MKFLTGDELVFGAVDLATLAPAKPMDIFFQELT